MNDPRRRVARSIVAEAAFRAAVIALGGQVVGEYVNVNTPVDCICPKGHPCRPRPDHVREGVGICLTCSGKCTIVAEAAFRVRVAELGGQVTGEYAGARKPVQCVCPEGHTCWPTPDHLKQRGNLCRTCSGKDPVVAEAAFRACVVEQGGRVTGRYVNAFAPVDCICQEGHVCWPTPVNVRRGQGICQTCARVDPVAAEAAFRTRVAELGGKVVGRYVGNRTPVKCICRNGHICQPWPTAVQQGQGICRACASVWDVFYVVTSPALGRVKFGVTSGDHRPRLGDHRRAGYTEEIRLLAGLSDAYALECRVLDTLRDAGSVAVHGREYFAIAALPVVLDIVDGWAVADHHGDVAGPEPEVIDAPMLPYELPNVLSE